MQEDSIVQKVLDISSDVSHFLNNELLKDFVLLHNICPEYSKFELKQEVIAKRALFFSVKKRYALHIINKEGKKRDEFFYRGIVLRRSDYPSYTKKCLEKILDMVLKEEKISIKNICNYIEEVEEKMRNLIFQGDKSIAKPVTYKDKSSYKKVPSHILGCELWNKLEYNYFTPGSGGYQFKIKGIDTFIAPEKVLNNSNLFGPKNNYIVIPIEESRLPNYYIVDIDFMLEYSWNKRYREILEPIMTELNNYFRKRNY